MTDQEALDKFIDQFAIARQRRLQAIDRAVPAAVLEGQAALDALADERRALLAFEIPAAATRAELVRMWPPGLDPLPAWFIDPAAAAALDPAGVPCVVDLSAAAVEGAPGELDADREAAILAKRAEKAPAEDVARLQFQQRLEAGEFTAAEQLQMRLGLSVEQLREILREADGGAA